MKTDLPVSGVQLMLSDLAAFCGRIYKLIRVNKLAVLHILEQMLRVRMLEHQVTWKR